LRKIFVDLRRDPERIVRLCPSPETSLLIVQWIEVNVIGLQLLVSTNVFAKDRSVEGTIGYVRKPTSAFYQSPFSPQRLVLQTCNWVEINKIDQTIVRAPKSI